MPNWVKHLIWLGWILAWVAGVGFGLMACLTEGDDVYGDAAFWLIIFACCITVPSLNEANNKEE